MDKKWRQSIFQLLPLDGRYSLTVALKAYTDISLSIRRERKLLSIALIECIIDLNNIV